MTRRDPRWNWEKRLQRWLARLFGIAPLWAAFEREQYGDQQETR